MLIRKSFLAMVLMSLLVAGCQSPASRVISALDVTTWKIPSFDFQKFQFRSQNPMNDDFERNERTKFVGDYSTIAGLNMLVLEGVGLVTGLDGTGEDPPPSSYRTAIQQEMKRRDVHNAKELLKSPNTAVVIVRAYLPPMIRKGDHFDIEVRLPENSQAKSLDGGWLLETQLSEHAIVPGGKRLDGRIDARAAGPILISARGNEKEELAGVLRRGFVLGGGSSKIERNLSLFLRNKYRNVRWSSKVSDEIGKRFYEYSRYGVRESLATAKTDQRIELKITDRYRNNFPRFLQVIRKIAVGENNVEQHVRIEKLKQELNVPETAEDAAVQLEAIGFKAIPALKTGLDNNSLEVRFHAAVTLAYLGEAVGVNVLSEAVKKEPAFRVYALAALSVIEDNRAAIVLRELMNEKSAEVRYGAFRALSTLDEKDPYIAGIKVNDEFNLHEVSSKAAPMIHLTNRKKAEIVLFGENLKFTTPVVVKAGPKIQVIGQAGTNKILVSRYSLGEAPYKKITSTNVMDIVRAVSEMGASYPDIAQMLVQAHNQKNLNARLELDALPRAGRVYYRPNTPEGSITQRKTRVGNTRFTPNMFDAGIAKESKNRAESVAEDDPKKPEDSQGVTTVTDIRNSENLAKPEKEKEKLSFFQKMRPDRLFFGRH